MARSFNGTSDRLDLASAPVSALPMTLACWALVPSDTGGIHTLVNLSASAQDAHICLRVRGEQAGDPLEASLRGANSTGPASNASGFPYGQWVHCAGVFNSLTDVVVYMNGVAGSLTAGTATSFTPNQFACGVQNRNGGATQWLAGSAAEVAVYSAALTAAEVAALASRAALPADIRRASLVAYWRLWGNASERDLVAGSLLTATGTARADHPPVPIKRRGRGQRLFVPEAAAATPSGRGRRRSAALTYHLLRLARGGR